MTNSSSRTEILKWIVAALLAAMLVGAAALAYWLPVNGYTVTCEKTEIVSCELQRETSSVSQTSQVSLGAVAHAEAAAAQLNRVFSSATPASATIVVRPPAYFTWMIWGGLGFLALLVLAIYRELFKPERGPD